MSAQPSRRTLTYLRAADIHVRLGNGWPAILAQLGVPEEYRREKVRNREVHGPCPGCGGHDRFFFDNHRGRGDYFCRACGAGDGFKLLELVHGWSFSEARKRVIAAMGLVESAPKMQTAAVQVRERDPAEASQPPDRVRRLRRGCCNVELCTCAVDYLASRGLWPLPIGCILRAHATVEYWNGEVRMGRFPALVADVVDVAGELVTVHTTYLEAGKKLAGYEPRKIWSKMSGHEGCAVRLMPASGDVLGVAEGIETALSAALLDSIPVWAALNTSLLRRFKPPPGVTRLRVYADRDLAGLLAAVELLERLQGRIRLEIRTPPGEPGTDWNDVLMTRRGLIPASKQP